MTVPAKAAPTWQLGRRLSLKPYGDELLTRSGDFWIFSARLIVLTMALAEAIAWGYMGSLMSRQYPLVTAAIAGLFVFVLIWIVDATFVTLDVSRAFYERVLSGKQESPVHEKWRLAAGIAARLAIVTASLVITAPFLAQAIFAGDVRDEMARRNAVTMASTREKLEQPYLSRLEGLRGEQKSLEEQRVKEAAGIGPSGRYGRGPALQTIEGQLQAKLNEIAALEAARTNAMARFDSLPRAQVEEQYGLRMLTSGVRSSAEVLGELLKNPQFRGAETAVRAFLAFLFAGLLILKIFQPRSVAVYYNEQLHSIHDQYSKGMFDNDLPEPERVRSGGSIDPLRFEEWCVNAYAAVRREDERRKETGRESRIHELAVEQWQRLEASSRSELVPLSQRYDEAVGSMHDMENDLHEARSEAAALAAELEEVERTFASVTALVGNGSVGDAAFERALAASGELKERRRMLSTRLRATEGAIAMMTRRLSLLERETVGLRDEIADKGMVASDARKRIAGERLRLAEIIERQRVSWTPEA